MVDGGDPAGVSRQPGAPQLAGQDRRGRTGHRTDLGADDQVARAEVGAQAGPQAHNHYLAERAVAQRPGLLRRARGSVARADDSGRVRQIAKAAAQRPGLDPQRRAQEQRVLGVGLAKLLAVARSRDGIRHALPPDVWAVTYRPSALRGKARRYRW